MHKLKNCVLCRECMTEPIQLPCFHSFCEACLDKFESGESSNCPQCNSSFSHPSELSKNQFLSNLVNNDKSLGCDLPCPTHPSLIVNFFCVDCEVTGCPLCSTGSHDNHNFIDLQEMAKVIKDELGIVRGEVEKSHSKIEKQVSSEKDKLIDTTRKMNLTCNEIREKGEFLKSVIDRQVDNLLTQVKQVERRLLRGNELYNKQAKQLSSGTMAYFLEYIDSLVKYGSAQDLIDNVRTLKAQSVEVKTMRVIKKDADHENSVKFLPSSIHSENISLVGHIEIGKEAKSSLNLNGHHDKLSNGNAQDSKDYKNKGNNTQNEEEDHDALYQENSTKKLANEKLDKKLNDVFKNKDSSSLKTPAKLHKELFFGEAVSSLAVGKGRLYVAQERGGLISVYNLEDFKEKDGGLDVVGLEAAWDMVAIQNDPLQQTSLFVVDNLKGKLFQIDIPYNATISLNQCLQKEWQLDLDGSATLSNSPDHHLLITTTNNKLIEYSLSSLLITSSSSSPSLILPKPEQEFSIIPHMTDILHAVKVDSNKYVALYHHLYELSGIFSVNTWGHMDRSFGGGRGNDPEFQVDYPCHIAIHPSSSAPEFELAPISSTKDNAILFICDNSNDRISCFDTNLHHTGVVIDNIESPWRLAVIPERRMLLVLTLNHSVCLYGY